MFCLYCLLLIHFYNFFYFSLGTEFYNGGLCRSDKETVHAALVCILLTNMKCGYVTSNLMICMTLDKIQFVMVREIFSVSVSMKHILDSARC